MTSIGITTFNVGSNPLAGSNPFVVGNQPGTFFNPDQRIIKISDTGAKMLWDEDFFDWNYFERRGFEIEALMKPFYIQTVSLSHKRTPHTRTIIHRYTNIHIYYIYI